MAARGTIAKESIKNTLIETFGDKYLGEMGGKLYILEEENGQKVQIAIALTCPKIGIELDESPQSDEPFPTNFSLYKALEVEMTKAEEETVQDLIKKLNL